MSTWHKIWRIIFLLFILQAMATMVSAQFYNGHQMTFGKSRVQYNDFYWQYYRFPKFDTYFYVNGAKLAEYVSQIAMEELNFIEYNLEEILQRRIIFIVYNKQSEFRQSNIGLVSGSEETNIGGVTRIVDNKVFVYFDGDHEKLRRQIRASIAEVLINEMLYGGSFRDRVSASTLLNLPEWFVPGLISYIAYDLDFETEAQIKNAILDGKVQKIHRLHGNQAKIAGHAFWRYLAEIYGDPVVSQIVYMSRISKNVETGFLYVLGMPMEDLINDWFYYHQARYTDELKNKDSIPSTKKALGKKIKKNKVYAQLKISPDGNKIAYTTNQDGQYSIWIYDVQTRKSKRILKKENKLEQIPDFSFPILSWHPNSKFLTYVYERKGHIWFQYYDIETKEKTTRELFYLDKVLDYSFSDDGQEAVISAIDNGYTDIFVYSIIAGTYNRITNDVADDINPRFVNQSKQIVFSSNRKTTQLNYEKGESPELIKNYDIFVYDYENKSEELTQMTNTYRIDEIKPMGYDKDKFLYLTNKNGIYNLGFAAFDSTISYIDTSVHYRSYTKMFPLSNRKFSINGFDFNINNSQYGESSKETKKFQLLTKTMDTEPTPLPEGMVDTWFRNYMEEKTQMDSLKRSEVPEYETDSIALAANDELLNDTLIDVNNYIFEIEKQDFNLEEEEEEGSRFKLPKQMLYFTNFYSNLLVTQVDFGFMHQSYQAFTGSAFYYTPGFNLLTKVGAIDLFEDYKITGGIRFSLDFESNEYLLSVENLKNRLDKQYIYHRQVFDVINYYEYSKIFTNELMVVYKYPISQILALRGTVSARTDEKVYKAADLNSLNKPSEYKFWGGLKGEFILDNTRSLGINLYDGTRLKAFGEYYNQLGQDQNNHLFVIGADVRNYFPLHRDLIFASRVAWSSSFGNSLLMYYLGGVDNWLNFGENNPTFDYSTEINRGKNWVYQAVGTNMRGFIQNVRNGNSFAVANFELRWPIIRYIFNRPISSDFFNNFMVVGFTDIGSAWEGWNPATANNAYDYKIISQPPVTVKIDRKHSPFVTGVGFGLRTRFLGYYIRTDWAWGYDGGRSLPRVFYLSLCTDF